MQSFKSFGVDLIKLWLDLIFPEKLLVHTGRVRYDLGRVRYFSLWSFELKFGGDLPLVSKELWLKFHDFWTPFDGVLDFSLLVSLLLKIPDVSEIIPDVSENTGRVRYNTGRVRYLQEQCCFLLGVCSFGLRSVFRLLCGDPLCSEGASTLL